MFPAGSQTGVRWSRVADRVEYSISFFDGFNHLPNILGSAGSTPLEFVINPRLWIGLAITAAFLAAAVQLRRYREPI